MSDITAIQALRAATIPSSLAAVIWSSEPSVYAPTGRNEPGHRLPGRVPTADEQAQARHFLAAMNAQPIVNNRVMQMFLRLINAGMSGRERMSAEDLSDVVPIYVMAAAHLPASAFSAEVAAMGLRAWKWFPGTAEVVELASSACAEWINQKSRLEAFIRLPCRPEPIDVKTDPGPTMEEQAALAVKMREFNAEQGRKMAKKEVMPLSMKEVTISPEYLAELRASNPIVTKTKAMNGKN